MEIFVELLQELYAFLATILINFGIELPDLFGDDAETETEE